MGSAWGEKVAANVAAGSDAPGDNHGDNTVRKMDWSELGFTPIPGEAESDISALAAVAAAPAALAPPAPPASSTSQTALRGRCRASTS